MSEVYGQLRYYFSNIYFLSECSGDGGDQGQNAADSDGAPAKGAAGGGGIVAQRPEVKSPLPKNIVLPVLMIACDRITVSRSLDILLKSVWPPPPLGPL